MANLKGLSAIKHFEGEGGNKKMMDFNEIVNKFISRHGIKSVVKNVKTEGNKCEISLMGGFGISLELIDDVLYKDDNFYCKVEELGN